MNLLDELAKLILARPDPPILKSLVFQEVALNTFIRRYMSSSKDLCKKKRSPSCSLLASSWKSCVHNLKIYWSHQIDIV